jgi:hypothetical protein
MTASTASATTILKRRIALAAVLVAGVAAILAPGTSARETLVHSYVQRDGTVVVSGFDGGAPLAPAQP